MISLVEMTLRLQEKKKFWVQMQALKKRSFKGGPTRESLTTNSVAWSSLIRSGKSALKNMSRRLKVSREWEGWKLSRLRYGLALLVTCCQLKDKVDDWKVEKRSENTKKEKKEDEKRCVFEVRRKGTAEKGKNGKCLHSHKLNENCEK